MPQRLWRSSRISSALGRATIPAMETTYPARWSVRGDAGYVGKVVLHAGALELSGRSRDGARTHRLSVSFDELAGSPTGVAIERVANVPTMVLARVGGPPVHVASVNGFGTLHEVADTIAREVVRRRVRPNARVLIAGGGVAGLEATVALKKLARGAADTTVLSSTPEFSYRPLAVAEPFEPGAMPTFELAPIVADNGARLHIGQLAAVDPVERRVRTTSGDILEYDLLLVALGARAEEVVRGALTFGPPAIAAMRSLLRDAVEGRVRRIVFAVPGATTWPLPLYELALLTARHLRASGQEVELSVVTAEAEPLGVFGEEASRLVATLLEEQGVALVADTYATAFANGELETVPGGRIEADRVVALPRLRGPGVEGLPRDNQGFIPVDAYGHVVGLPEVFAAGDATAFPVKQGGIAAQQAETAAAAIAARLGAPVTPMPLNPVLRGVLLGDDDAIFLRTVLTGGVGTESTVAVDRLWSAPGKIVGRHLSSYLATAAAPASRASDGPPAAAAALP